MTTEPTKPKPRRRWWQYSLRTFFVLLTVFCVWLGWTVHRANEQRKVVEWVKEMGGVVRYYYEFADGHFINDAKPPGPKWLRDFLGANYFQTVTVVDLYDTQVSDLTPLAGLKSLEFLGLQSTNVSVLSPLANVTSLQWLDLHNTPVSKEQVEELQQALPNCTIYWSPPDPSP